MKYIFFRIIKAIPVVFGVTILTFLLLYFSPLDPAQIHFHQLGVTPTKEMLFEFQEKNGLNVGFIGQYLHWWRGILHGDFGESFADAIPVIKKLSMAIPYTVVLAFASLFLTLLISIPFGFFAKLYCGPWVDVFTFITPPFDSNFDRKSTSWGNYASTDSEYWDEWKVHSAN